MIFFSHLPFSSNNDNLEKSLLHWILKFPLHLVSFNFLINVYRLNLNETNTVR